MEDEAEISGCDLPLGPVSHIGLIWGWEDVPVFRVYILLALRGLYDERIVGGGQIRFISDCLSSPAQLFTCIKYIAFARQCT
jgi:hypothetical protein